MFSFSQELTLWYDNQGFFYFGYRAYPEAITTYTSGTLDIFMKKYYFFSLLPT
jgi:hypothetical protein